LKTELLRAINQAGFGLVDQNIFNLNSAGLISIKGSSLIKALVADMKARAEVRKAA